MNFFRIIFLVILFSAVSFLAQADASMTYEYDLPGLVGNHSHIDQPITVPFDLKTKFTFISSVEIRLEGRAIPGLAVSTTNSLQNYQLPVTLNFRIANNLNTRYAHIETPIAKFGSLHDFFLVQQYFITRDIIKNKKVNIDWSFLKDGIGEIRFNWGGGCPDACQFVDHAMVEISRATLIIKGEVQ
ncbi:MAG: hypothetical protein H7Y27_00780 [Gemmatimonadaceae bacterium]|nr:hypothetical protein [Chitinophagaceae bacterium]